MSDAAPETVEVREALSRLLAWPDIARSGQLARFLEYIVDRKIEGQSAAIKAYSIAVDVFGRSPDFDPQTDPIVRVQARRLRMLLDGYYAQAGSADRVRITLPTGRYVPEFVYAQPVAPLRSTMTEPKLASRFSDRFVFAWIVLALLALLLTLVAVLTSSWVAPDAGRKSADVPVVSIMEMTSLTGSTDDVGLVAGLAVEMVTDLEQFESIAVVYGEGRTQVGDWADYALTGMVRRTDGALHYSAILTDMGTGAVVWDKTVSVDASAPDVVDRVSGALSRTLGSPRGPLHRRARAEVADGEASEGRETPYLCRVLFGLYRERATAELAERTQRCYRALPAEDQQSGPVLAALASLLAEEGATAGQNLTRAERIEEARALSAQAVVASPVSGFVWEQRARFFDIAGEHDASEAAFSSALQLNPASTDALAARARHVALMGDAEAGAALAALAIADDPAPPAWYFLAPALQNLRAREYSQAAQQAVRYATMDGELGPILVVLAGQGLGDEQLVDRYLPRVLEAARFREVGILTRLRRRISDEMLIRDIGTALLAAGVSSAALNEPF